ncbi:hypothetical protein BN2475_490030 [Paraburkholderia ribeironis]|uniref:Uncharacterized protein n=1 Tax=Paraburkholderia ribeironis TaxID=1247936 RepID=A0A1N7SBH4_9BURK|nr:hypothetical protein BN2475_490030 [Paraburkholderia ribeironis]
MEGGCTKIICHRWIGYRKRDCFVLASDSVRIRKYIEAFVQRKVRTEQLKRMPLRFEGMNDTGQANGFGQANSVRANISSCLYNDISLADNLLK